MDPSRLLACCLLLTGLGGACRAAVPAGPVADATPLLRPELVAAATVIVPGFDIDGSDREGVYGRDDLDDDIVERFAALSGVPSASDDLFAPNQIALVQYYGRVPPDYYSAQDIADVSAVTDQYGGGIPRYATIVAKFIRHMQARSGATEVHLVGVSMGGLVTRWLVEYDLDGLVRDGTLRRWITVEGVVRGNYLSSKGLLDDLVDLLNLNRIDLEHMHYDWLGRHLPAGSSREDLNNPLFRHLVIGHITSTDDSPFNRGLTQATQAEYGEDGGLPNDGIQLARDSAFRTADPAARYLGLAPMQAWSDNTHWSIEDDPGAYVLLTGLVHGARRVALAMTEVEIFDAKDDTIFDDDSEGEVVLEAGVYSPLALARQGITRALSSLTHKGGVAHFERLKEDRPRALDYVFFDATVLPEETALRVSVRAVEIDFSTFYGDPGPFTGDDTQGYDRGEVTVSLAAPASYEVTTGDWRCVLEVRLLDLPAPHVPALFSLSRQWQRPSAVNLEGGPLFEKGDLVGVIEGGTP